jgi:thioester reductase-like protein
VETDDVSEWAGIYNGYSQTKWVSERLVVNAGRRGLPVAIYRPPLIGGHSKTGAWRQDDLVYILLKGSLQLGLVPNVPWELDLVPVDYVSDAVTALCWNEKSIGRSFNLHHPQQTFLTDYVRKLIDIGAPFSVVEMSEWLQAINDDPTNVLHPLRGFFTRRWGPDQLTYPELNQSGYRARPGTALTTKALSEYNVSCPSFDDLIAPWSASLLSDKRP